ncbi:Ig-like domain repeat protein [Methanobrevibacter boviskoreani]|uniref:beta strand repeat-containing protein n=1 Tax=Methanobrevibacter boviskoreani TaxID=1348249 RepID=UPI002A90CBEB|nr:Ig-like domain repeat protein [Methanobrevibacter boviskoreani]MDY5614227.1 Ig-like domain repeat protein [Methanobrevibacter boviskoreani]
MSNLSDTNNNFDVDMNSSNISTQNSNYENSNTVLPSNSNNNVSTLTDEEDHSFTDLQSLLDSSKSDTISLTNNYICNGAIDSEIINAGGISFSPSETGSYTINGNGHFIDGNNLTRIFNCNNFNGNLTLKNIIFKGGSSTQNGGAIYWYTDYTLNLINCTFINCKSNGGGAIYAKSINGTIINSTFINNTANSGGGAIQWTSDNVTITNTGFTNNTASNFGGAIYLIGSNAALTNISFTNNTAAGYGGSIYWGGANGTAINTTFTNNTVKNFGGAVYWFGANGTAINTTFANNTASYYGGAISWSGANGKTINSRFVNNKVDYYGGAIRWSGANGSTVNSTFANNTGAYGGSIFYIDTDSTAINSEFINNTAEFGGAIFLYNAGFKVNNSNFTNNKAAVGSAFYDYYTENKNFTNHMNNTIILDNQAYSNDLNFENFTGSNVTLIFTGLNTNFNGIYFQDNYGNNNLSVANLTYWSESGITNTGNAPKEYLPNYDSTQAGIDIHVTVRDFNNNTIIDQIYRTDENGKVLVDLSKYNSKYFNISASLKNDTYYTPIANNTVYDNKVNTTTTGLIQNISYGMENITIIFNDNLSGNISVLLNGTVYNGTVENGISHINIGIKDVDNYTPLISYSGDNNYNEFKDMPLNFTVHKANPEIITNINNSTYGDINTIDITLIGVNGELLNGTVKVDINGTGYDLTLDNGKAKLELNNLSAGDYPVKVHYSGSNNYNNYTNETSFTVNKIDTSLDVSLIDTYFNGKNHTVRFNITLKDSNQNLLNKTVDVTVNNKTYAVDLVNGTNILKVDDLSSGNYTIESRFNGTDNHAPPNDTRNFTIDLLKPELTVNTITNKNNVTVYINLIYNGTGINGTVTVTVDNKKYNVDIIDGKGNLTISNLKNSRYNMDTVFDGDKIYSNAINNSSFEINVPDKNSTNNHTDNRNNTNNTNNINNNINKNSPINNGQESGINVQTSTLPKTGNPIFALLLALIILIVAKKPKS